MPILWLLGICGRVHYDNSGAPVKKINSALQASVILLLLAMASLFFTGHADAKERIVAYDVTAELQEDASLLMTERIRVTIEHVSIKHGIYRVFPQSQDMGNNKTKYFDYDFESITLDGKAVDYAKASKSGNIAVAIGSEKKRAPLGEHVYEIRYRTTNHVLFFPDRDEIYLNVTGNEWKLPIDAASFTFIIPGGVANILKTTAFTGAYGESGSDFVMEAKNVFRTTRPFAVGEGLTVAVAWKKGLATAPVPFRIGWIADNWEVSFLVLFGLLALYYYLCRRQLKENVPPVIPLFSAPEGMSPGYAAALKDIRDTGRIFQADVMWTAVNGFLRLDMKNAKNIVMHENEPKKEPKKWIASHCRHVASMLLDPERPCNLKTKQGKIQAGKTYEYLKKDYTREQRDLWRNNLLMKVAGWTAMVILAYGVGIAVDYQLVQGESKWMYPASVLMMYFFSGMGLLCFNARREKGRGILAKTGYLLLGWMLYPLGLAMLVVQMEGNPHLWLSQGGLFFATSFFMGRLPNPSRTPKAMESYAQILGLEMYIRTAEQHRLAMINAPEDTIEKYEEILPYAVALGCADAWQKRFDKLLRNLDYTPKWVDHTNPDYYKVISTVSSVTAMSVAIDACVSAHHASTRSFSGSGFSSSDSSSGSSGGGSGGGGGGGW